LIEKDGTIYQTASLFRVKVYEAVTDRQNTSLKWLIKELTETLGVSMQEVYRHPQVGRKNETEASSAKW
jgi:hypothetical protein